MSEAGMDEERIREAAEHNQLWASLRRLLPEIERMAAGDFGGSEHDRQMTQILARVAAAELHYRTARAEPD